MSLESLEQAHHAIDASLARMATALRRATWEAAGLREEARHALGIIRRETEAISRVMAELRHVGGREA